MPVQTPAPRHEGVLFPSRIAAVQVLLGVAMVVGGYLIWASAAGGGVAGCGLDSNCHAVLNSRWAYWLGVPVSALALLVYATLFVAVLWLDSASPAPQRRRAWQILIPGAVMLVGAGLWFIFLQMVVLRTICPYCMIAHGCALAASTVLLTNLPLRNPPEQRRKSEREVFVRPRVALQLGLAAVAGLALLIAGQTLYQPTTYTSTPVVAGVSMADSTPAAPREFHLFDGRFQLNLEEVPLIGRPDASHIMVSLFDYTCHHCRELHTPLMEAWHHFSNHLAIINLVMPLDGACNPLVRRALPVHVNACALARIGLAVWLADRPASKTFDDWLFAPSIPPPPAAAEDYARQLVGSQAFDQAVTNRWINGQISTNIALYEAVYRQYKQSHMPQVIVGTNLLSGVVSRDRLFHLLSEQFGLNSGSPMQP